MWALFFFLGVLLLMAETRAAGGGGNGGGYAWGELRPDVPFADLIVIAAGRHGIAPCLLAAVAWWETRGSFNPGAINNSGGDAARGGSYGLCQVSLKTAQWLRPGISPQQLLDPATNLDVAAQYIAWLQFSYGLAMPESIGAYNAGPDLEPAAAAESYRQGVYQALSRVVI